MPRNLAPNHQTALEQKKQPTRRTTLVITLGDGTILPYSTGTYSHSGINYLGKIAPTDALNLEDTPADEGLNLKISNVPLTLGQDLINNKAKLDGTYAELGCYFRGSSGEWHDKKLPGRIESGDIDAPWINVFFQSLGKKAYYGKTIADMFPDEQIPADETPVITNPFRHGVSEFDEFQGRGKFINYREFDDFAGFGERNYLPLELEDF